MRRRKILFVTLLLLFGIIIVNIPQDTKNTKIIINERKQNIVSSNALSMLYETEVGSGEYQISTDTTWPEEGYVFNATLSKCENGGTLSWDDETKRVIMQTNTSDKCYVYFDKYAVPTINNVNITKTYNSISLTVDAAKGNNDIVKYYYSNNDGSSYVNSISNSYTFSGLTPNSEYKIKVFAEDSLGYTSSVYEMAVTTNVYTNPSVTNVTTSNITTDSITLNVTASGGTNNVKTYYYSKDDGSSYVNSTSNSYTFSGLTSDTTYNFKVYVVDNSGYSSNTKSISATTDKETNIEITNATGHAGEVSIGVDSISINSINPIKMYYVKFSNLTNNTESNIISFTEIPYIYYSYYDIILPCFKPSNNVIAELYAEDIYGNISNVYEFSLNITGSWACP